MPPGPTTTAAPNAAAAPANANPIVTENQKPGAAPSSWQIAPGQDSTQIQGFTTSMSSPLGGTVQFKINNQTGNGTYKINIYRLGYYGGNGATLVTTLNHSGSPVVQPNPIRNSSTGEVDAGNWSVTNSWSVPSTATSGVYIANVIDGSQIFQIPFIVSNPSSTSNIVFQTSDETWQAYNGFGGDSLYGGNGPSIWHARRRVCSQLQSAHFDARFYWHVRGSAGFFVRRRVFGDLLARAKRVRRFLYFRH